MLLMKVTVDIFISSLKSMHMSRIHGYSSLDHVYITTTIIKSRTTIAQAPST